jgi:hypothetical protein
MYVFTDEHRANLSLAQKHSPKSKAARHRLHAMPQCRPGREFTPEHRAKLSIAAKRREARKRAKRAIVAKQSMRLTSIGPERAQVALPVSAASAELATSRQVPILWPGDEWQMKADQCAPRKEAAK